MSEDNESPMIDELDEFIKNCISRKKNIADEAKTLTKRLLEVEKEIRCSDQKMDSLIIEMEEREALVQTLSNKKSCLIEEMKDIAKRGKELQSVLNCIGFECSDAIKRISGKQEK